MVSYTLLVRKCVEYIEETEKERRIRLGEITPFMPTNAAPQIFSSDDESEYEEEAQLEEEAFDDEENRYDDIFVDNDDQASSDSDVDPNYPDDGDDKIYKTRIQSYIESLRSVRLKKHPSTAKSSDLETELSCLKKYEIEPGFFVMKKIWKRLFDYQRTCLRWLYTLHDQETGGILGDEMVCVY